MVTAKRGEHATQTVKGSRFREVRWVESTGSTNNDLMALAAEGEPEGLVLVADYQSSGRGRRDRVWEAPPGASLLFSMLLRPVDAAVVAPLVTMAAGLASMEATTQLLAMATNGAVSAEHEDAPRDAGAMPYATTASQPPTLGVGAPRLKWPNDLLIDGKKLSGMLTETVVAGGEVTAVVIGIGINVNWPCDLPVELAQTATALNFHVSRNRTSDSVSVSPAGGRTASNPPGGHTGPSQADGVELDREVLLVTLLRSMDSYLDLLETANGRAQLLARYKQNLGTLGLTVQVETTHETFVGVAHDVDEGGRLLVREATSGEQRWVSTADVVHLRPS